MLYVSTRNTVDTYTAHHALCETTAPDGGFYVPFHLPVFTQDALTAMRSQSCGETIAQVLNLFFGLHLTQWDIECKIGRNPIKVETIQHKLLIAECWRNPDASYGYLHKCLYDLMTNEETPCKLPVGWSCVGIEIALLFGMFTAIEHTHTALDIAVTSGDFMTMTAISYAKKMGLPVNLTVCTCSEDSTFWDLLNKGTLSTNTTDFTPGRPNYLECFLFVNFGADAACQYLQSKEQKGNYFIDENQQQQLSENVFVAVVSSNRVDAVISNMVRTCGYNLDIDAALAFGGLQDYRSSTGINIPTLIISKRRPARMKE